MFLVVSSSPKLLFIYLYKLLYILDDYNDKNKLLIFLNKFY